MPNERIKIIKMPFGEFTDQGAFYAQVDGENIGTKHRHHFQTKQEAIECAEEFIRLSSASAA